MLQENGIDDPYPLDATIEYEHNKKLPKPIIATETNPKDKSSFNYEDPEDTRYGSNDMPEYDVETKADFKANQEAADWLMHDPNKFNVMPDEDTKTLFNGDKESNGKTLDDPIRLDNDDKQDPGYQNFNDDNQEIYTKIQESLAPDSNMAKIYSKYEKFLNQFDQKLKGMNKNVKDENDYVENDVIGDDSAGSDVTTEKYGDGNELMNSDSDANGKNVNGMTSPEDNNESQNDENKAKTSKVKDIALDEALKLKLLKALQEKIKMNQEKVIVNRKHEKESSTPSSGEGKENRAESSRHDNTSSGKSVSSASSESPTEVLPVFRISHLHKPTSESQERDVSPRVDAPSTEKGTSRQNVDINR